MMPKKMANANPTGNNPNCVGENVSPQLSWSGAPEGTKSFVLLMEDPEGRGGAGVHHMVTYGIDAKMTGFAEGELSKPSDKFVGGKATQGTGIYNGPCTPANVQPHHYTFVLVATDFGPYGGRSLREWRPIRARRSVVCGGSVYPEPTFPA